MEGASETQKKSACKESGIFRDIRHKGLNILKHIYSHCIKLISAGKRVSVPHSLTIGNGML